MHKLYYVKYTLIYGKEQEDIADRYLFTENDVHPGTYNCETFWDLFGVIRELKDLYSYTSCFFDYTRTTHTFFGKVKGPHVSIYGLHTNWDFDEKNFKTPVQIKVSYTECSPSKYGFDFYKENLSYDNLVIFLRETIGVAMDEDVLRLFLKK